MDQQNFKGVRFCPKCSNLLKPREVEEDKLLIFQCRYCKYQEPIKDFNEDDQEQFIIRRKQIKAQAMKTSAKQDSKLLALDLTMSRCEIECPKCSHYDNVFYITSDNMDTKIIKVYICTSFNEEGLPDCGYQWNSDEAKQFNKIRNIQDQDYDFDQLEEINVNN